MEISDNTKFILYGGAIILITNLIIQDDWDITLFSAIIFVLGGLILPPLFRFMSNIKKDNRYK
jgi:hypothetical protein